MSSKIGHSVLAPLLKLPKMSSIVMLLGVRSRPSNATPAPTPLLSFPPLGTEQGGLLFLAMMTTILTPSESPALCCPKCNANECQNPHQTHRQLGGTGLLWWHGSAVVAGVSFLWAQGSAVWPLGLFGPVWACSQNPGTSMMRVSPLWPAEKNQLRATQRFKLRDCQPSVGSSYSGSEAACSTRGRTLAGLALAQAGDVIRSLW